MANNQKLEGLKIEEIKKILEDGNFEKLKSQQESYYFEAKLQKPYEVDSTDSTRRFSAIVKLASDVASLANGGGGYIVCGLQTQKLQNVPHDMVTGFDFIIQADFYDQSAIQALIIDSIHPRLELKLEWYAAKIDDKHGLGTIFVPPQDESKKHFIVKVAEVDGNKLTRNFVGIPIRQGSDTIWLSVEQIYRLIKRIPSNFQQLNESLSGQLTELKDILLSTSEVKMPADDLSRKIGEVLDVH